MSQFQKFILAFSSQAEAWHFIQKHRLWYFLWVPFICNLVLLGVVIYFIFHFSTDISQWLNNLYDLPEVENWTYFIYNLLLISLGLFGLFFGFRYLSLIILSPLFSYISERTHAIMLNKKSSLSAKTVMRDIYRGTFIAVRNLFLEYMFLFLLLIISFFIVTIPITAVLAFLISGYFIGFSIVYFRNEFYHFTVKDSIRLLRANWGFVLGIGIIFQVLLYIPVVGTFFGIPLGVVASSIGMEKINPKGEIIKRSKR